MKFRLRHDIDQEAARWVVRMNSDLVTPRDKAAFAAWLAKDPAHNAAYDSHAALWTAIPALHHDTLVTTSSHERRSEQVDVQRRGLLAASVAGFVVAGAGGWCAWKLLAPEAYATAAGEQRSIALADGSTVTLNMDSALRVHFDGAQRRAWLDRGQAFFNVANESARPFRVFAGADEVRVLSGAFDVCCKGKGASVTLEEGSASVFRNADQSESIHARNRPAIVLTPNEQALVSPAEPVKVAFVDARQAIAWRR